jgi:hypothetical protein
MLFFVPAMEHGAGKGVVPDFDRGVCQVLLWMGPKATAAFVWRTALHVARFTWRLWYRIC